MSMQFSAAWQPLGSLHAEYTPPDPTGPWQIGIPLGCGRQCCEDMQITPGFSGSHVPPPLELLELLDELDELELLDDELDELELPDDELELDALDALEELDALPAPEPDELDELFEDPPPAPLDELPDSPPFPEEPEPEPLPLPVVSSVSSIGAPSKVEPSAQ